MNSTAQNYEAEVISYFKNKAEKYDLVDNQIYWVFSDALLWHLLQDQILNKLPKSFHFLDAGGGTGRWTLKILEAYPEATGVIFDLSEDMTNEAVKKAEKLNVLDRLKIINGNLNNINQFLGDAEFDLIYNFHNVLGFVDNPNQIIKNLHTLLKDDAILVSMVPNKYHNIFFNIATSNLSEAQSATKDSMGRFTTTMPSMHLFTPDSIKKIYAENQLQVDLLTGFPNFIYPGFLETQIEGTTQKLNDILSTNNESLYDIEKAHLASKDIAARGNNIFIVGKKTK